MNNNPIPSLIISLSSPKSFSISRESQNGRIIYRAKVVLCGPQQDLNLIQEYYKTENIKSNIVENNRKNYKLIFMDSHCLSVIKDIEKLHPKPEVLSPIIELLEKKKELKSAPNSSPNRTYEPLYLEYKAAIEANT